ncbi:MAG: GspH/FimT family pseudopilin [Xanthomonadales bacterium]|nr:GspH/FimT family pseudopilin [Xanthomonadales bacterium]
MPTSHSNHGFTLIELLTTVAVACVLISMALPSFARLGAHTRVRSVDNALVEALHFARASAVHHGAAVLLCPSNDGQHCADSMRWDHGWLIGTDRDHDNQPDGKPLRVGKGLPAHVSAISSTGRRHVRYRADGASPGSNLSIIICRHGQADGAHSIVVSNAGRIRQGKPTSKQASACAAAE